MECQWDKNNAVCTCTYAACSSHAVCCDCMAKHLKRRQLPACYFPAEAEATFDRSFEHFARCVGQGDV